MKIETKFDIGQKVWFLIDNKINSSIINSIKLFTREKFNQIEIVYFINGFDNPFFTQALFESEEKLLEKNNITLIKIAAN